MAQELQQLVDALAVRLGRATLVEDRRQNVIAYSRHDEAPGLATDEVRRLTILRRQADPGVMTWLQTLGISDSKRALRIPGNDKLHMLPRVCVPLRHSDLLLGYLWFVDADATMTDDEIELAQASASVFSSTLYHHNMLGDLAYRRENGAVRDLLFADRETQERSAQALIDDGSFAPGVAIVALVAQPVMKADRTADETVRLALEHALLAARRRATPQDALHLVRGDHGVLLVAQTSSRWPSLEQNAISLQENLRAVTASIDSVDSVVVGVGSPRSQLRDARASYDEARQAGRIAGLSLSHGPIAHWAQLGIYRLLSRLSAEDVNSAIEHSGLERLLADDSAEALVETLETYLDLAGNAQATAEHLQLHRTTLYYRLGRVEQFVGTDLRDGNNRLALHLGLKIARLDGRLRGSMAAPRVAREETSRVIQLEGRHATVAEIRLPSSGSLSPAAFGDASI